MEQYIITEYNPDRSKIIEHSTGTFEELVCVMFRLVQHPAHDRTSFDLMPLSESDVGEGTD